MYNFNIYFTDIRVVAVTYDINFTIYMAWVCSLVTFENKLNKKFFTKYKENLIEVGLEDQQQYL